MTKDELIEAMKDFPGNMEVKIKALQYIGMENPYESYEYDNCDIGSINKCYYHSGDYILIGLQKH